MAKRKLTAAEERVVAELERKGHDHAADVVRSGRGATGRDRQRIIKTDEKVNGGNGTGFIR